MSQKQMLELIDKLSRLFAELPPLEASQALTSIVDEWQDEDLIPPQSADAILASGASQAPPSLIEAASGPLGDRLNWNRNNEFQRAMRAKTVQEFSDALR